MNNEIQAEWKRSIKSLAAAETLLEHEFNEDAISRVYYAIVHAAKASLLSQNVEVTSHTAVIRLFGLHFIRIGETLL